MHWKSLGLGALSCLALSSCATGGVTDLGPTSATLNGTLRSAGEEVSWFFQYAASPSAPDGPGARTTATRVLPAGSPETPVAAKVDGLVPGTIYRYRLCGRRAADPAPLCLQTRSFATAGAGAKGAVTFSVAGRFSQWRVPDGVRWVFVDETGAAGGKGYDAKDRGAVVNGVHSASVPGGKGGRVRTTLPVTPGQLVGVWVGSAGQDTPAVPTGAGACSIEAEDSPGWGGRGGSTDSDGGGGNGGTGAGGPCGFGAGGPGGGAMSRVEATADVSAIAGGGGGAGGAHASGAGGANPGADGGLPGRTTAEAPDGGGNGQGGTTTDAGAGGTNRGEPGYATGGGAGGTNFFSAFDPDRPFRAWGRGGGGGGGGAFAGGGGGSGSTTMTGAGLEDIVPGAGGGGSNRVTNGIATTHSTGVQPGDGYVTLFWGS